jgi:hypothetical protein
MIPNLNPTTLMMLIFGVSTFIFIMFLPALLELKKPRDAGPRITMDDVIIAQRFRDREIIRLANIEKEKFGLDQTIVKRITNIVSFLPNLEA